MNLEDFTRELERIRRWRTESPAAHNGTTPDLTDCPNAFDLALEELRVAEEELSRLTDRLAHLQQTWESERRRYQDLFDFAPVAYLVTDASGMVIEANQAGAEVLNVRLQHLIGKAFTCFVADDAQAAFRAELAALQHADGISRFDLRIRPRRKSPIHVSFAVTVGRDAENRPRRLRWAMIDVTERVKNDDTLRSLYVEVESRAVARARELVSSIREGENRLIALHDALHDGVDPASLLDRTEIVFWEADTPTGHCRAVGGRPEALLGFPAARWLEDAELRQNLIHPDDRDRVVSDRVRCIAEGRPQDIEYRAIAADGRVLRLREHVAPRRPLDGRPGPVRGLIMDVTARSRLDPAHETSSRVDEKLADQRRLADRLGFLPPVDQVAPLAGEILRTLVAELGADSGAVYIGPTPGAGWRLITAQGMPDGFARAAGSIPEVSSWRGRLLAVDDLLVVEDLRSVPDVGPLLTLLRVSGTRSAVSLPILGRSGECLGSIVAFSSSRRRLTEREIDFARRYIRRAAEVLENAVLRERLREGEHRRTEAVRLLADELRTPLSSILRFIEGLSSLNPDECTEAVAALKSESMRMGRLVDDLRDVCDSSVDGEPTDRRLIDLASVVLDAVGVVRPVLDERGIAISVAVPDGPAIVHGDPDRLERALAHLIANAARFGPAKGNVRLSVEAEAEAEGFRIRIRDDGPGIPPHLLPRVFDPFTQEDRKRGGLGIGLAYVRNVVTRHGGSVTVVNPREGRGCEFAVHLPGARVSTVSDPSVPETD